jgi:NADPH:quinone reductase-like Zn-dependent oxidoreductase
MGMIRNGALASVVLAEKNMLWNVPEHWTIEDAATVPVVYGTVSYHEVKSELENLILSQLDLKNICDI